MIAALLILAALLFVAAVSLGVAVNTWFWLLVLLALVAAVFAARGAP